MALGQTYNWDTLHPFSFLVDSIRYLLCDEDKAADPQYFGTCDKTGSWKILEYNATNGTYRYARGDSGYVDAWTDRANLTYGYPYEVW